MEERVELELIKPVTKIVVGKKFLYKNGYIHKDLVEELLEDKKELLAKGKDTYEVFHLIGAVQCLKELLCSWGKMLMKYLIKGFLEGPLIFIKSLFFWCIK